MALKHSHLMLVVLSVVFFFIRFYLAKLAGKPLPKWMKVTPHIIDTLLLLSAGALCVAIAQYPLVNFWLTAKVAFVIGYIGFAVAAMKSQSKNKAITFMSLSAICLIAAAKFAITKGQF
jgi:uncharacterized membrane protein SirB2